MGFFITYLYSIRLQPINLKCGPIWYNKIACYRVQDAIAYPTRPNYREGIAEVFSDIFIRNILEYKTHVVSKSPEEIEKFLTVSMMRTRGSHWRANFPADKIVERKVPFDKSE